MTYLSRDDIFALIFQRKEVEVEGLGTVLIRELSAAEQEGYARSVLSSDGKPDISKAKAMNAKLISMACIDTEGKQLFTQADINKLNLLPGGPIKALGQEILRLSGMLGDDPIGNSEKNLETASNGVSLSV